MFLRLCFKLCALVILFITISILYERAKFDVRTLVRINPIPHTQELISNQKYAKAHEYLSYFLNFDYVKQNFKAHELMKEINNKRTSFTYQSQKMLEGIMYGKSDETIGNSSAIISDFFLFGDLRDLTMQSYYYYKNKEVDEVIVILSAIGVIATATTYVSAGTSLTSKVGISSLKLARRTKKLPSWTIRYIKSIFPIMRQTKSIKPIVPIFKNINQINKNVGLTHTLNILNKTKTLKSLSSALKISTKYGKNSSVLLDIASKNSIKLLTKLKNSSRKNVLLASQYGEKGLKALSKLGSKTFLIRMAKTVKKGNIDFIYDYLVKRVPTYVLMFILIFISLIFFNPIKLMQKKRYPSH